MQHTPGIPHVEGIVHGHGAVRPQREHGPDDLSITSPAFDDDRVAFAHVFRATSPALCKVAIEISFELAKDGVEHRAWRDGARPVDVDARFQEEPGVGLLRGEFEGRCPARELRRRPEALAQREIVDLDHDAVGVEVEGPAFVRPFPAVSRDFVDTLAAAPVRFDGQALTASIAVSLCRGCYSVRLQVTFRPAEAGRYQVVE